MPTPSLTPVERGALFVLMAEGRPLKESSELKVIHGIGLRPTHRTKLQRLGLIHTTKKPVFTHALSEKGWLWARDQMTAAKPKGQIGAGALYSLLHGLQKHIERHLKHCRRPHPRTSTGLSNERLPPQSLCCSLSGMRAGSGNWRLP